MRFLSQTIHHTFTVTIILVGFLFWGAYHDGFRTVIGGDKVIVLRYHNTGDHP